MSIINITGIKGERESEPQKDIYYKGKYLGYRDGSAIKGIGSSFQRTQVQPPTLAHQLTTASPLVPRNMTLSSILGGHFMHMMHIHTCRQNAHTH